LLDVNQDISIYLQKNEKKTPSFPSKYEAQKEHIQTLLIGDKSVSHLQIKFKRGKPNLQTFISSEWNFKVTAIL